MLPDIDFPKSDEYRTGSAYEPLTFYMEALAERRRADLLLGYFSSSAISVLALGFAKFISNGGRMRLIINNVLSERDKAALIKGSTTDADHYAFTADDFQTLRWTLDGYGHHFFACVAWLIASGRIQIRAIKPKHGRGIAHYKSGVFYDGENKVRFKGSCNFTASGLLENLEELDVKTSWKLGDDAFVTYESEYDQLFAGTADHAELIPFEQIETMFVRDYGGKDLDELLVNEQQLLTQKTAHSHSPAHQTAVTKLTQHIDTYLTTPRFPYDSGPRPYQREAYENWVANDYKGVFAMATGTGKTITTLNCLLNEAAKTGTYQAVIVVPTTVLVEQWTHEARKFNFREVITVSGGSKTWQTDLSRIVTKFSFGVPTSFVVIVTYKLFAKAAFDSEVEPSNIALA